MKKTKKEVKKHGGTNFIIQTKRNVTAPSMENSYN